MVKKLRGKGSGGEENENLVFAIDRYTARGTRSFPRTRANRESWWGGEVHGSKDAEGEEKGKKGGRGWISSSPCNPAIYSPFSGSRIWGYSRVPRRLNRVTPYEGWRAVGWKGLVAALRRVTRRNKYNIMQTGGADRARQSLENLGNPE